MLAAVRFSSQYYIIRKPISHFYIREKSSQYGCSNNSYCISYFGFYIIIERLKKFLHPAQKSRAVSIMPTPGLIQTTKISRELSGGLYTNATSVKRSISSDKLQHHFCYLWAFRYLALFPKCPLTK